MLKKIVSVLGISVLVVSMIVGGFYAKSAQAQMAVKPVYLSTGGFRSYFFNATAATPHAQTAATPNDPAVAVMNDSNAPKVGTILYGFSVFAGTAGFTAGLFDEDKVNDMTTAALSRVAFIDELGEASQYDTTYSDWVAPKKLDAGLVIQTDRAPGVVSLYME